MTSLNEWLDKKIDMAYKYHPLDYPYFNLIRNLLDAYKLILEADRDD